LVRQLRHQIWFFLLCCSAGFADDRQTFEKAVADYSGTDAAAKAKAEALIRATGPKAGAWLMAQMRTREAVGGIPASRVRVLASQAVPALPDAVAKPLVPELGKALENDAFPSVFASALVRISPEGISELLRALASSNARTQQAVASALQTLTPRNADAVPAILDRLQASDQEGARIACLHAIASIRSRPELCVPALIKAMGEYSGRARGVAAFALGNFKGDAKQASAPLIALAKSADAATSDIANRSIWQIDEAAAKAAGLKKPRDEAGNSGGNQ
jgi:hypothetical protein